MNEEEKNASLIIVFVAEVRFFFLTWSTFLKIEIYLTFAHLQQTDIEYVAVIAEKIKKQ